MAKPPAGKKSPKAKTKAKTAKTANAREKSAKGRKRGGGHADGGDETGNLPKGYAPIRFTGGTWDYFRIWLVTLLLTILTLGLYWPWARVRRRRFFAAHTVIAGYGMAYHATGLQLFIGYIFALAVLALFTVISLVSSIAGLLILLPVYAFLIPWAIDRALSFNARYTTWRNIHFRWQPRYWKMFLIVNILPLVNIITLGFFVPVSTHIAYNHYARNHAFGTRRFAGELPLGKAYGAFFIAIIAAIGALIAGAIPIGMLAFLIGALIPEAGGAGAGLFGILPLLMGFTFIGVFLSICRNHLVQRMRLGRMARFTSAIHPGRYIWIEITNTLAVICTLGLLIPWATVRKYRYLAAMTGYRFTGNPDELLGRKSGKQSAFGEELAVTEGVGFDLGL